MLIEISDQEHATILAALRYYQENDQGEPASRSDAIHNIATDCDKVISLDEKGIDELCEHINTDKAPQQAIQKAYSALGVVKLDRKIRYWLKDNDPKALAQVSDAIRALEPYVKRKMRGTWIRRV